MTTPPVIYLRGHVIWRLHLWSSSTVASVWARSHLMKRYVPCVILYLIGWDLAHLTYKSTYRWAFGVFSCSLVIPIMYNRCMPCIRWNWNVVILMKFSSLAALEAVEMTASSAASDENFIKMMTFPSQCKMYCRHWFSLNIPFTIYLSYIVHGTDDLTMACVPYAHYWYYCIVIYVYIGHVSYAYRFNFIVLRWDYFAMFVFKLIQHVTVKIQFTVQVIIINLHMGCQHHRVNRDQLRLRYGWKN